MFRDGSRYARVASDSVKTDDGRDVTALRLRRLPATQGDGYEISQGERLDILAQRRFGDGTKFWHIADANTALDSRDLVARVLAVIKMPRS